MRNHGLFGEKLSHSMSPEIQKYIYSKIGYNAEYSLIEFEKSCIKDKVGLLKEGVLDGVNVTIPYKKEVMEYLDELDKNAENIGAVNTIVCNNGKLTGYNTDYYGIEKTLEPYGSPDGGDYLVLGYGGASRPLIQYLADNKAKTVFVASRNPEKYSDFKKNKTEIVFRGYDEIENITGRMIINTTPVGMYPDTDKSPVGREIFKNYSCAVDFIYNPHMTKFLKDASESGIMTQNGLKMLVYQAIRAVELWSSTDINENIQQDIYLHFRRENVESESIYLVGLPGSGKTTFGKIMAEKLGYVHIDLDEYIVEMNKMSIPEIFEKFGESGFRERETEALREVSSLKNTVVSTGGGAVTTKKNREILKKADMVIFIDRPCEDILQDVNLKDRPLLKNTPKRIFELRDERINFYNEVSHYTVKNDSTMEKMLSDIFSCL